MNRNPNGPAARAAQRNHRRWTIAGLAAVAVTVAMLTPSGSTTASPGSGGTMTFAVASID